MCKYPVGTVLRLKHLDKNPNALWTGLEVRVVPKHLVDNHWKDKDATGRGSVPVQPLPGNADHNLEPYYLLNECHWEFTIVSSPIEVVDKQYEDLYV